MSDLIRKSDVIKLVNCFAFSLYKEQLPNYNYYLKKINTLRKVMVNNQAKIVFLNKKMKENKKVNEKTLIRVKKLNEKA